jgi:hypothetical protein
LRWLSSAGTGDESGVGGAQGELTCVEAHRWGRSHLRLKAAAGANPEASARRDPEQMNGLVLLDAAGGLARLLPVRDGD